MRSSIFCKTMGNARKHWDIELVTTEKRRKYLVTEPSYHTPDDFCRKFVGYRNEKKLK